MVYIFSIFSSFNYAILAFIEFNSIFVSNVSDEFCRSSSIWASIMAASGWAWSSTRCSFSSSGSSLNLFIPSITKSCIWFLFRTSASVSFFSDGKLNWKSLPPSYWFATNCSSKGFGAAVLMSSEIKTGIELSILAAASPKSMLIWLLYTSGFGFESSSWNCVSRFYINRNYFF